MRDGVPVFTDDVASSNYPVFNGPASLRRFPHPAKPGSGSLGQLGTGSVVCVYARARVVQQSSNTEQ